MSQHHGESHYGAELGLQAVDLVGEFLFHVLSRTLRHGSTAAGSASRSVGFNRPPFFFPYTLGSALGIGKLYLSGRALSFGIGSNIGGLALGVGKLRSGSRAVSRGGFALRGCFLQRSGGLLTETQLRQSLFVTVSSVAQLR
jgi:hypothetical protein